MIADLHLHYPMHVVPPGDPPGQLLRSTAARARALDRVRAAGLHLFGRFANYNSFGSGPRVTIPRMHAGGVGVGLSVLYSFWDEIDWPRGPNTPPDPRYFVRLLRQLEAVEDELARSYPEEALLARSPAELKAAIAAQKTALIHCVEGGFHLGADPERIPRRVGELAQRGVAYITIGHLFNRRMAEVAPAIPFMSQQLWRTLFHQPQAPLRPAAKAAIRAMLDERVLIDLSHLTEHAMDAVLSLIDRLDSRREVPLLVTHAGVRFGSQEYNLSPRHIERIAERGGVIGLIFAEHQACDGLRAEPTRSFEDSIGVLCRHIDRIEELTGSHRHTAIGSDFDGYIRPTLAGLDDCSAMARVESALVERYGSEDGERIASGNVLRLLRTYWRS